MKSKPGFFEELIKRRIPQIIGMYIAAVWLAVEISDWMNERFDISDIFSSVVFVGMLAFIPSVILLSWGHGQPGKDRWRKTELVAIPLNLLAAFFIVKSIVIDESRAVATTVSTPPDPAPILQAYNTGNNKPLTDSSESENNINQHQKVISFFWDNKTDDQSIEWLQYGAPWLVSQDLKRTPVLSVETPYDSRKLLNGIVDKGFEDALDIPVSLALQLANSQSAKWMILGSFTKPADKIVFTIRLIDVITGNEVESISETNENLLTSLDRVAKRLNSILHEHLPKTENIIPGMAISEHTSNNINAIQSLIRAKNNVAFKNDYNAGIKDLMSALDMDKSFAEANVLAASYYRATGDIANAIDQTEKALKLDYKIYQEKVFALKANIFGMSGDNNKSLQVLETWVKFYPSSAVGLATLGKNYLVSDQLDNAREIYEKLSNINGLQESQLNLGRIYRLQNKKNDALQALHNYMNQNPENPDAYIELADAYKQFMILDKAREFYQQASIIGSKNFEAEIGLAYVTAFEGDFVNAIKQLHELLNRSENAEQKFEIMEALKYFYVQTGQINKALDIHKQQKEPAKEALNPLNYLFTVNGGEIELLIQKGEFEKAIEFIEKLQSETKPPFNQIVSAYYLIVYRAMEEFGKYELELNKFEEFLQSYPIPYYENMLFAWKANLASWKKQYKQAEDYFNQALEYSKKSFVRLETLEVVDMIHYAKAYSQFNQKRYKETIEELNLILEHNPLYGYAHYLKAKSYMRLQLKKEAQDEISNARRIWEFADNEFVGLKQLISLENELTE